MRRFLVVFFMIFLASLFVPSRVLATNQCICVGPVIDGILAKVGTGVSFCEEGIAYQPSLPACAWVSAGGSIYPIKISSCSCSPKVGCGTEGLPPCQLSANAQTALDVFLSVGGVLPFSATPKACSPGYRVATTGGMCTATNSKNVQGPIIPFTLCQQTGTVGSKSNLECQNCLTNKKGVWTAIGCVPTSREGITTSAVMLGLGTAGAAMLLATLGASAKLAISKGDPKGVDESKEWITSIFGGILFILFSMVMLNTIGVKFLQIPGF